MSLKTTLDMDIQQGIYSEIKRLQAMELGSEDVNLPAVEEIQIHAGMVSVADDLVEKIGEFDDVGDENSTVVLGATEFLDKSVDILQGGKCLSPNNYKVLLNIICELSCRAQKLKLEDLNDKRLFGDLSAEQLAVFS